MSWLDLDTKGDGILKKNLKGTQTEKNLAAAFAGESQARNKYTYFAGVARDDGYEQVAKIFEQTADNERAHAQRLSGFLGLVGETNENLKHAAEGENYEHTQMYPDFAKVAEEEGFGEIAKVLKEIGEIEEHHEKRYLKLLKEVQDGTAFKRTKETVWECTNCGYLHEGLEAPSVCPACAYPQGYYRVWAEPN
jgi:rubrerythrin